MFNDIINNNSNKSTLIVGTNQTGKSTLIKEIVSKIKTKDIIYITPYILEPTQEKNILFINPKDFFKQDFFNLSESLIIFDDCKAYISTNIIEHNTKVINDLMIQRRYLKIEIIFSFHSFAQVPTFLYDYITEMYIKKTTDNLVKLKSRLNNYEIIADTQRIVNSKKDNYFYMKIDL